MKLKVNLINKSAEGMAKGFFPTEKQYFWARTALELLGKNKLEAAKKFISEKLDMSENLQNNNPILNFVYFVIFILENQNKDLKFENFEMLIRKYQTAIESDPQMIKYLNSISKVFYERQIINEEEEAKKGGMNLGNILKMFG